MNAKHTRLFEHIKYCCMQQASELIKSQLANCHAIKTHIRKFMEELCLFSIISIHGRRSGERHCFALIGAKLCVYFRNRKFLFSISYFLIFIRFRLICEFLFSSVSIQRNMFFFWKQIRLHTFYSMHGIHSEIHIFHFNNEFDCNDFSIEFYFPR